MDDNWEAQYEDTAKRLELLGDNEAADDIRTLIDGLKQYEREEKGKVKPQEAPRFLTPKDALDSDYFPSMIELPREYFPVGIGPGSFDPHLLYAHALTMRNSSVGGSMPMEMKCWVILWLLDHVDWQALGLKNCSQCGRDLHGYASFTVKPLCRYCDPKADVE